jgi:hypothetical protein
MCAHFFAIGFAINISPVDKHINNSPVENHIDSSRLHATLQSRGFAEAQGFHELGI